MAPVLADVLGTGLRDEEERAFAAAVEAEPKIELHVHMEAAVPAVFYERLNRRRPLYPPELLPARRAPFTAFHSFIAAWSDQLRLLDEEPLLAELARAFCAGRRVQNIA